MKDIDEITVIDDNHLAIVRVINIGILKLLKAPVKDAFLSDGQTVMINGLEYVVMQSAISPKSTDEILEESTLMLKESLR